MPILEKFQRLSNRQIQNIIDVFSFIDNIQHRLFKALAFAIRAGDIDIGKKLHFNLFKSFSFACLTAPAGNIE